MRNKRFPNYPDDADYTTNAPSYYDDLARKEKLMQLLAQRIWGYEKILDETLEEIQDRFREWDKNLEDFPDDVNNYLQIWLNNGTLDHIINDTIFNWKLDTVIFEQFRHATNTQLNQTDGRINTLVANAGDTDGNAELLDIRVSWDGTIYPTAGEATRSLQQLMTEANEPWGVV